MATKNTRVFSDIDLSFEKHPATKDIFAKYDTNAIKNSVKNLVMTKHFERHFHSEVGSNVNSMLFELAGPVMVSLLKTEITDVITNFEPRVVVQDIQVAFSRDTNYVYVNIIFNIVNISEPITISLTLDRTR